ncbi:MAG: cytochrome c3 family protein [Candidatus Hydrogenedentes bacterium]|nr:cytochrome c3 family protein [Candidatus Hydrogenedentota bacterium]
MHRNQDETDTLVVRCPAWKSILVLMVAFLLMEHLIGCQTPDRKYRTLSIFFDGVPDPNAPVLNYTGENKTRIEEESTWSFHLPFAERKCDACHSGTFSNALRAEKNLLCATCHTSDQIGGTYIHGPVASGQCYACHHPHKSKLPHLLLAEGPELCIQCHDTETYPQLETHRAEKGDACLECHNPHASENAYLIQ